MVEARPALFPSLEVREFFAAPLGDPTLSSCAKLFSEHYGVWGPQARHLQGQRVKLSEKLLRERFFNDERCSLVTARVGGIPVGHAFALRFPFWNPAGPCVGGAQALWITQLVVHTEFRSMGIAKRMLNAIRDDRYAAVGLISSNPAAVRALEAMMMLRCRPEYIRRYADELIHSSGLHYMQSDSRNPPILRKLNEVVGGDHKTTCSIDTEFFVDHSSVNERINACLTQPHWSMGSLEEGHEFFAFVFASQKVWEGQNRAPITDSEPDALVPVMQEPRIGDPALLWKRYLDPDQYVPTSVRGTISRHLPEDCQYQIYLTTSMPIPADAREEIFGLL